MLLRLLLLALASATGGSVACGGISRTATQGAIFRLNAGLNAGLRLRGGAGEDKIALSENENGGGEGADLNCTSPVLRAEGCLQRIPLQFILGTGAESEGSSVVVCGWAKTVRIQGAGAFAFMELNDGTTFKNLQVCS